MSVPEKDKPAIQIILKLFISGASPNSVRAINNIQKILEEHLKDRYTLSVIDIYQEKVLAQQEQIIALPLLIRKFPLPERRLIGDMSNTVKVLDYLEITRD